MSRMAAADAQLLWLSEAVPNDQFLLYAFDGAPDIPAGLAAARRGAERCEALLMRVTDDCVWRYPRWVRGELTPEQFVVHDGPGWPADRLDPTEAAWRLHVFPPDVVVVQMSHALGDGRRSAALAGRLFGRQAPVPPVFCADRGKPVRRALAAARRHRDLPPPNPPRPALSVNGAPGGAPVRRTMLVDRDRLTPTVTIGALVAVAEALGGYCAARGEDISRLAAEVPMAAAGPARANNHFRNVTVGLYPELGPAGRAGRIAADLEIQRRRIGHPAVLAADAAFAAAPAWLLRWGVSKFDPSARSSGVWGNTVVSSVNRGPADLRFGGRPVRYTAGFPALSPMQRLTHGVHGIGGTVAIGVHADPVIVDVDEYLVRLADALGCKP